MTTSTGLREVTDADLDQALERVLVSRLADLLSARGPGHCMRVNDLGGELAVVLARRLRSLLGGGAGVHVLGGPPQIPAEVAVTGTKLVELRNPDSEGALRPVLCVFVPPGSQTSAEDSFGVATFEEVTLGDSYADLSGRLLAGIPQDLRSAVTVVFDVLDGEVGPGGTVVSGGTVGAGEVSRARFLLTVSLNDNDPAAAGAALFELGLIPDFELFSDLTQVRTQVTQNLRAVQILGRPDRTVRQRVVDLRLREAAFRARLADLVVRTGLDDARSWTRRIVADPANWPLSFHRWPLPDDQPVRSVELVMGELALPRAGGSAEHDRHPVLGSITGQPYLITGSSGPAQLMAQFDVRPDPRHVPGLAAFVVQLISEDSGPTGVRATVAVSSTARRTYRATLRKLRSAHLDPGWHYLRVLPLGRDNTPLPVASGDRAGDRAANESERFFVVAADGADGLDEPPVAPRTRGSIGVTQELRQLELAAAAEGRDWRGVECTTVAWQADGGAALQAAFGAHGRVEIPLSTVLVEIERAILAEPERLTPRRLRSASGLPAHVVHSAETQGAGETGRTADAEVAATFRQARAQVLEAIRGQDQMIVAGRDILTLRERVLAYAEAYAEVLSHRLRQAERAGDRPGALRDLAALLRIDAVVVEHRDARDAPAEITLVAPTHPLRLLWLLTWAELGRTWSGDAAGRDPSVVLPLTESLAGLRPSGFPLVVPREDGRLSMAAGDFGPYWQVCLPSETQDPQALLAEVSASLGLPDRAQDESEVSSSRLADCVERYVRMHPYVHTLVICAVNAGRGERLADMLLELERRRTTRHLCHDVRLFATDPQTPGTGEALADLLNGRWSTVAEAEAFQTPTISRSTPKLAVAVRPLAEFRSATSRHTAHLTLLFDAFSGESLGVGPEPRRAPAPVHGLVQGIVVDYVDDEDEVCWHKQPRHGRAGDLTGAEELSDLLATLPELISRAAAAVSTGETGTGQVPRATLSLTAADRALLHQAHRSSDWVITVDRTLGVEYFDNPGSLRRPDYIIDVAATGRLGTGHQMVISSRSVDELHALLAPMIVQHGFEVDRRHAGTFFDQLRLLSGRLAFKIASTAPNQRTEVLGLALARLYLACQGALDDQVLVPLDSHLELYRDARRRVDEVAESVGLQRTDLALFSLDARRRTVVCRLVEVKCYSGLSGVAEAQRVRERMAGQLNRSAEVLAENFDPELHSPDRPDRVVRNAQLAALLKFHLGRAVRHGVMKADAAAEAGWLLDHLDRGYRWDVTRTGLIFDLSGRGTDRDVDGGIEYHTVGRDVVEELLGALPTDPVLAGGYGTASTGTATLAGRELSVPRLDHPGFRGPERSHEIPPDEPGAVAHPDEASAEPPAELSSVPLAAPSTEDLPDPASPAPTASRDGREPPPTDLHVAAGPSTGDASTPVPPVHVADAARDQPDAPPRPAPARRPDVYLGSAGPSPQYGVLGEAFGRRLALDLNETHTISLFGVQGGGKSYTLGSVIEAASLPAPPVNHLPSPLATIVFHYSPTPDYAPEFTSMVAPNDDADQVHLLREHYGVEPAALGDVVMLVPGSQVVQRQAEYPGIEVRALAFGSAELQARHWRFLMGALGNQSTYIRQLNRIMRAVRSRLTLQAIRDGVDNSSLADSIKQRAHERLDLAADYIDDSVRVGDLVRPGRMIIVDLRDDLMEKDEALGLFVVLMELFAAATSGQERFNKLVVFDEAHKYIESPDLVASLVESVREMRHKGMSVLVASQDPPSVPLALIELSDHVILHRFNSPGWLKHLQKANTALADLTSAKMNALTPGEAYIWAGKATDPAFTRSAVKVSLRPRITRHGGGTRTAVDRR
jgi:hypothetical protein